MQALALLVLIAVALILLAAALLNGSERKGAPAEADAPERLKNTPII